MSIRRAVITASTLAAISALAACNQSPTEPTALAPRATSFQRGADDTLPRQQPQPGDDRGGTRTSATTGTNTTGTNTTSGEPQPGDDRGRGGHGVDDPANHH